MIMNAKFYYFRKDALAAAERYANDNNGIVKPTTIDDRTPIASEEYDDKFRDEVINTGGWSGETSAFAVIDAQGEPMMIFPYWDFE